MQQENMSLQLERMELRCGEVEECGFIVDADAVFVKPDRLGHKSVGIASGSAINDFIYHMRDWDAATRDLVWNERPGPHNRAALYVPNHRRQQVVDFVVQEGRVIAEVGTSLQQMLADSSIHVVSDDTHEFYLGRFCARKRRRQGKK